MVYELCVDGKAANADEVFLVLISSDHAVAQLCAGDPEFHQANSLCETDFSVRFGVSKRATEWTDREKGCFVTRYRTALFLLLPFFFLIRGPNFYWCLINKYLIHGWFVVSFVLEGFKIQGVS